MQDREQFGQFNSEHLRSIRPGIELFNQQKYWECHEELEELWLSDRGDNARFVYWAIIQVATCLIHYREENIIGANGMLKKALEKISKIENLQVETDLLYNYLNWKNFKYELKSIPEAPRLENFKNLFEYRFTPEPVTWEI